MDHRGGDLVEVNPLIVTPEREVRALDAKVTLDGNALYRHPENAVLLGLRERGPDRSGGPRSRASSYVKLDGDIGILGNGAGLVMSTLDVVARARRRAGQLPRRRRRGSKAEEITARRSR